MLDDICVLNNVVNYSLCHSTNTKIVCVLLFWCWVCYLLSGSNERGKKGEDLSRSGEVASKVHYGAGCDSCGVISLYYQHSSRTVSWIFVAELMSQTTVLKMLLLEKHGKDASLLEARRIEAHTSLYVCTHVPMHLDSFLFFFSFLIIFIHKSIILL